MSFQPLSKELTNKRKAMYTGLIHDIKNAGSMSMDNIRNCTCMPIDTHSY